MEKIEQEEEKELPRFVTCIAGLLLCPITLISIIGSLVIVFDPQVDNLPLTLGLGTVFLFASIYGFALSIRMITGAKQKSGGLLPPLALRVVGGLFLLIPVAALLTGTFMEEPFLRGSQTLVYILVFLGLNKLANTRSAPNE